MKREEIIDLRAAKILQGAEKYTIGKILLLLRNNLRLTRAVVSEETDISEFRLMCLELGKSIKNVRVYEIHVLSNYYNIDFDFLMRKAQDFYHPLMRKNAA